jgi:hypothetical protein
MRRILVVANQTLGGDALLEVLRDRLAGGPCRLHLLVPSSVDSTGWMHDHHSDRVLAQQRLEAGRERLAEALDTEVTGEIGDHRPGDAILDVLRREEFDEVVLSTLPARVSRWVRMDAASQVRRVVDVPVTHVAAADEPVASH